MQGLGRTQDVNHFVSLGDSTFKRAIGRMPTTSNLTGGIAESLETGLDRQPESSEEINAKGVIGQVASQALHKSFRDWLSDQLEAIDKDRAMRRRSNGVDTQEDGKIDLTFGVEPLSYKNMWKVLKTVVKEIGHIKEAHADRFFLGVSERLEKAKTLMEFGSLADYLVKKTEVSLRDLLSRATEEPAKQIMFNPVTSLQAQANVEPEAALHLLT